MGKFAPKGIIFTRFIIIIFKKERKNIKVILIFKVHALKDKISKEKII